MSLPDWGGEDVGGTIFVEKDKLFVVQAEP